MKKIVLMLMLIQSVSIIYTSSDEVSRYEKNNEISDDDLGQKLFQAAANGHDKIFEMIMDNKRLDEISADSFGQAFRIASAGGHYKIAEMIVQNKRFDEIGAGYLGWALDGAAQNGHEKIVEMIMQNKRFNEISAGKLGEAFYGAAAHGKDKIFEMIIQNKRFDQIGTDELGWALEGAAIKGYKKIVEMIMQNKRFNEISDDYLGRVLAISAEHSQDTIVEMIMQNKRFDQIGAGYLEATLGLSAQNGYEKIVKMTMQNKRFDEIGRMDLRWALTLSVKNGHEKVVNLLLQSDRVRRFVGPSLIQNAVKNKQDGIVHLLKAYSALKPELNPELMSEEELKDLSLVDKQFYEAYKKFLSGDANDLRNLIFPIAKKGNSNIYAIYPKANAESSAINLISKSLVKLFKPDYIRSLIITLVETNAQKESARELLELMGISKKDSAATKIQSAYKRYKTRKNLAAEREQELEEQEKIKPSSQEHYSMAREERF